MTRDIRRRHAALLALNAASARLSRRARDPARPASDASDAREIAGLASSDIAPRVCLEAFVGFLQDNDLLPRALQYPEHDARLQGLAQIAQAGFGLYLWDEDCLPWSRSSSLSAALLQIAEDGTECDASFMPASFGARAFVSLVSGKGDAWIGAAAVAIRDRGSREPGELARHVASEADACDMDLARRAIGDVEEAMGGRRPEWPRKGPGLLRRGLSMLAR